MILFLFFFFCLKDNTNKSTIKHSVKSIKQYNFWLFAIVFHSNICRQTLLFSWLWLVRISILFRTHLTINSNLKHTKIRPDNQTIQPKFIGFIVFFFFRFVLSHQPNQKTLNRQTKNRRTQCGFNVCSWSSKTGLLKM